MPGRREVLGGGESECLILSPPVSMIQYRRTLISLPITPTEAWVSEEIHRQQSNLSFSGLPSHYSPFCANQVCEAFPLFCISWINCKICQPLPVPLVLSWEVPPSLPGKHKAALVFNWRNVEMHCRSSLTLSQPDISESLGLPPIYSETDPPSSGEANL